MLTNRWHVLALLFAVRTGMGFQFQAVPALSPLFLGEFGVSVADLGLLIGLYFAPGVALALPGGAIAKRFGDKRIVLLGLVAMIAGGLVMALLPTWPMQLTGRLVAGIGGILLNVVMTKMVTDWFADADLATAMGIFINSWPVGIALALVTLPTIAAASGLQVALLTIAVYIATATLALAILYRPPGAAKQGPGFGGIAASGRPTGFALWAVLTAGLIWGLYNASLTMIFGFGTLMLSEQGWTVAAASSTTSIVLWLVAVSVPLGGLIADRTRQTTAVLIGGLVAFALALLIATRVEAKLPAFVVLGLVSGLAAGPIMSLSSRVLTPETRAVGIGIFFTVFYAAQVSGPALAGLAAKTFGSTRVAFDLGAVFVAGCGVALMVFFTLAARVAASSAPTTR